MTIGDRIHMIRTDLGMTMEELGEKVGVQKSAVNKWEKGIVSNIKSSTVARIAYALDVSPVWLLGLENDQQKADAEEEQLIKLFRSLNDEGRTFVLQMAEYAAEKYTKKDSHVSHGIG